MEETVKALGTKLAQLEARVAKKNEGDASTSTNSHGSPESLPLRIKLESFSALSGESWLAWLRKFKCIAVLNTWSPELTSVLKGLAEQTFYSLTDEQTAT